MLPRVGQAHYIDVPSLLDWKREEPAGLSVLTYLVVQRRAVRAVALNGLYMRWTIIPVYLQASQSSFTCELEIQIIKAIPTLNQAQLAPVSHVNDDI